MKYAAFIFLFWMSLVAPFGGISKAKASYGEPWMCKGYFVHRGFEFDSQDLSISDPELMEKIWVLKKKSSIEFEVWRDKILNELQYGKIVKKENLKKLNSTAFGYIITFSSGMKAIFKFPNRPFIDDYANPAAEVAVYTLDTLLGLDVVPITTFRKIYGIKGSIQLFVDIQRVDIFKSKDYVQTNSYQKVRMLDYLAWNWDRANNLFHGIRTSEFIAIDYGIAFVDVNDVHIIPHMNILRDHLHFKNSTIANILLRVKIEEVRSRLQNILGKKYSENVISRIYELQTLYGIKP